MLEFGVKPPFSYDYFLVLCKDHLETRDMDIIKKISIEPSEEKESESSILKEWKNFDIALRNEIVKFRAIKKSKDASEYIRGETCLDSFTSSLAHWFTNQDSPLEQELSFDRLRWDKIEELGKFHYFNIEYLIGYGLKLKILERWERINSANGMETLEKVVSKETA